MAELLLIGYVLAGIVVLVITACTSDLVHRGAASDAGTGAFAVMVVAFWPVLVVIGLLSLIGRMFR